LIFFFSFFFCLEIGFEDFGGSLNQSCGGWHECISVGCCCHGFAFVVVDVVVVVAVVVVQGSIMISFVLV